MHVKPLGHRVERGALGPVNRCNVANACCGCCLPPPALVAHGYCASKQIRWSERERYAAPETQGVCVRVLIACLWDARARAPVVHHKRQTADCCSSWKGWCPWWWCGRGGQGASTAHPNWKFKAQSQATPSLTNSKERELSWNPVPSADRGETIHDVCRQGKTDRWCERWKSLGKFESFESVSQWVGQWWCHTRGGGGGVSTKQGRCRRGFPSCAVKRTASHGLLGKAGPSKSLPEIHTQLYHWWSTSAARLVKTTPLSACVRMQTEAPRCTRRCSASNRATQHTRQPATAAQQPLIVLCCCYCCYCQLLLLVPLPPSHVRVPDTISTLRRRSL